MKGINFFPPNHMNVLNTVINKAEKHRTTLQNGNTSNQHFLFHSSYFSIISRFGW